MSRFIGVDVGGTNLRVGVVEGREVLWETRHRADFSSLCREHEPMLALEKISSELEGAISQALALYPDAASVGIGFPGFIDPATGIVSMSPNLPGLSDVDIAGPLARRLTRPVTIENDALCAAWGEYLMAERRPRSMVYLGLGTGVGGGLILDGRPYPGQHGVAMEVGHLIVHPGGRACGCGNSGCLERYASASGLTLTYQEMNGQEIDSATIAELAMAGDVGARQAYAVAARALAAALAHILKVVDVGTVVIGGGMSASWPLLVEEFEQALDAALIPALRGRVNIELARAGDQAGLLGAARLKR